MTNPLTERRKEKWIGNGPPLTREDLIEYADTLNAGRLAKLQGVEWMVNSRRADDGQVQWYLTKRDLHAMREPWKPRDGETAATAEVVARYASDPRVTQEQFNSLVRRGVIAREVEAAMMEQV